MGLNWKTRPRRPVIRAVAGGVCLAVLCCFCGVAFALSSVNVPLDHWSYDAIDKLQGFGLIKSAIYDTRPYSRLEMARLINEALNSYPYTDKKTPPLINHLIEKLQYEFRMEVAEVSEAAANRTFFKPIQEAQAKYVYINGDPRHFTGFPRSSSGIDATEGTALLPNNEGVIYTGHHNFSLQFATSARFFDIFSAYVEPIFVARENRTNLDGADDFEADLHKGYAKITKWNVEIEAGRDSLWWGQGYHGSLLLSNNAAPLDMVKLSNPTPSMLPWYFKYLGLIKYSLFFARLDDDRDFDYPWLVGGHIVFKPHPIIEFGATATTIVGGEGRTFNLLDRDVSNILASVDARLRLPFLKNAQIYGELGGEDRPGPDEVLLGQIGYLVGIYFPIIFSNGRTDLRVEYSNTDSPRTFNRSFWYGHAIYTSGYTFDKMILGHHMDGDADDLFVRATHYITDKLRAGVDYDYMQRGKSLGIVTERVNSIGADLSYDINKWLTLSGRFAYGTASNFDMVPDDDRENHLFMTTIKVSF